MRKYLATSLALFFVGLLCCAQSPSANFPPGTFQSRAALDVATSVFPCVGTNIHVTSPNDLSNAAWGGSATTNINRTFGQLDPLGGSNATSLIAVGSPGAFGVVVAQPLGSMTGGVTYAFSAYLKTVVNPTWILFAVTDNIANSFAQWFNLAGSGTPGGQSSGGTASISCGLIIPDAGGYNRVSIAGAFSVTNTLGNIGIYLVDGDGSGTPTLTQEIYAYQVSP